MVVVIADDVPVGTTPGPAHDGAERLRDAALALFGEQGYAATTVRAIAERAGVTAGLVVHHYGTKENLRAAVDRYVLESASEASVAFFDQLMMVSRSLFEPLRAAGLTRPTDDPDAQLLLSMLSGLMPALLPRHVERFLGVSLRSDEGVRRWAKAEYEFMTHGALVPGPGTGEAWHEQEHDEDR